MFDPLNIASEERTTGAALYKKFEPSTVRDLIDQQARSRGDKAAFVYPETDTQISFLELRDRTVKLAFWLVESGCEKGDRVAYALYNGQQAIELYLGGQYGGFVSVPLNPDESLDTLSSQLRHSGAKIFVCDGNVDGLAGLRTELPDLKLLVTADELSRKCEETLPPRHGGLPPLSSSDENVLDYTSGTSGTPKGVMMRHHKVLASARIHVQAHQQTDHDIGILLLPLFHMNAQHVSVLSSVYSAGTVVVPRRFIASRFLDLVRRYGVTWFAAVPTMLAELNRITTENWESSLRFGRSSSAPLPEDLHRAIESKLNVPIIEAMGMTETGGTFCFNPLPPGKRKFGSVGIPVGYELKVVNETGKEAPVLSDGEILLRGEAVMEGYYKHCETTSFQDGWLRTGDIGYQDEDGFCYITGREKDIVIKGGINISTRAVEEVLLGNANVNEAAVYGVHDPLYGEELVASIVAKDNAIFDESALILWCGERLGRTKTPGRIFCRDVLPRNSMGKVTKDALRREFQSCLQETASKRQDGNLDQKEVESSLAKLWEETLQVSPISVDDNFFDLGGYSLAAVQILDKIEERYKQVLPVSVFLEHGTIRGLATVLSSGTKPDEWRSIVPIKPSGSNPPFFGLFAEDHVLFYHDMVKGLDEEQPFYGIQSISLKPDANPPARLSDLARLYVKDVMKVQPTGPYLLGGQCTGAKLALEMAHRFKELGQEVALLVVFDSSGPRLSVRSKTPRYFANRLIAHVREGTIFLLMLGVAQRSIAYSFARLMTFFPRILRLPLQSKERSTRPPRPHLVMQERLFEKARLKAIRKQWHSWHRTKPYPGGIVLIRSTEFATRAHKQAGVDRWRELSQSMETYVVPGGHISMFHKPNSAVLARRLQQCIDKAVSGIPSVHHLN